MQNQSPQLPLAKGRLLCLALSLLVVPVRAGSLYSDDFEAAEPGTCPVPWQGLAPLWPGAETFAVRSMDADGQALELKGRYFHWLGIPFAPPIEHGTLHIGFDVRLADKHEKLWAALSVDDESAPVDVGWHLPREHGVYLWIHDREEGPGLYAVAWDRKQTLLTKLKPQTWYRVAVALDLGRRRCDIAIDGKTVASDIPSRDANWFRAADKLILRGGSILVDNFEVSHEPGDPADVRVPSSLAIRSRSVPAHRLESAPDIDGAIADGEWADAWQTRTWYEAEGSVAQTSARLRLGFQGDFLYLAAQTAAGAAPRELRIAIDPSGSRYQRHLWLKLDQQGTASRGTSDGRAMEMPWRSSVRHDGGTWTVECAIPLSACARTYAPAPAWALNVTLTGDGLPVMLCPDGGEPNNTVRFAMLTGLGASNTLPVRFAVEPIAAPHTGTHPVRVQVWNASDADLGSVVTSMNVSRPDGQSPSIDSKPLQMGPRARTSVVYQVEMDRPGGYALQMGAWPPGVEAGQRIRDLQLGAGAMHFAEVLEPGSLTLLTDRDYYTTETTARVQGTLSGAALPPRAKVQWTVRRDDERLLRGQSAIDASPFMIDLDLADVPLGAAELTVSVLDAGDAPIAEARAPLVRRAPRREEVKIRWDNVTLVGGQPFFPIFLWSGDMLKVRTLGCNTALIGSFQLPLERFEHGLDLARRWGLKVMYWPANPFVNPDEAPAKIEAMRDNPTMLAWLVEDEPNPLPKSLPVRHLRDRIDALDPYRPTFLTYLASWGRVYRDGLVPADAVGINAYASYWHYEPRGVWRSVQTLNANVDDGRPVWPTLQAWHSKANRAHPRPGELRHSVWSAIVAGATGFGFWGVDLRNGFAGEDIRGLQSDPLLWAEVAATVRAARRLSPVLTSDQLVRPDASVDNDRMRVRTWRHDGATWALLVNLRAGPERVTLALPGATGRLANELEPGGSWPIVDGRCRLRLGPLQAVMLRTF